MSDTPVSLRRRKVPTLYESDESRYVGPHRWQVRWWARALRRALRWHGYTRWYRQAIRRLEVHGLEYLDDLEGPLLFVANHQSHVDALVVHAALPERFRSRLYFGAAQDRWFVRGRKKLVLQPWYQSLVLGTFPILRGGGQRALGYAAELLQAGNNVFLFPEGTRATGSELGEFKHGASILAIRNGVPIVPMYLAGLKSIRPKGAREVTPGDAAVHILEPLRFGPDTDVAHATHLIRDRMLAVHRQFEGDGPIAARAA